MAKNLFDLADAMERKAASIAKSANKTAVDTAMVIVGDLVYKTPVDTSKALSNWIVTLGFKNEGRIEPHFPGISGSTFQSSAAEAIADAKRILAKKKPGQLVYITNNLPYIKRLNQGYSGQAPAGFVERAVLIGRKQAEKFKIKD